MTKTKRHFIVPDPQVRPGVNIAHIDWAARAIVEYKPDTIILLGDWWDMHALSSHDEPGSESMENARYWDDVNAGNRAFERLVKPMRRRMERDKKWKPRCEFLFGNHEHRITRAVKREPRLTGAYTLDHLNTQGFRRNGFLQRVWLDGIVYSHYFQAQNSAHAIGGSVDNRLNKIGDSFVQGHQQGFLYGNRVYPTGKIRHGLVAGSFYMHDEDYKGPQGNDHWRGVVVLNEVHDGDYSIMPLSIDYLKRKFA